MQNDGVGFDCICNRNVTIGACHARPQCEEERNAIGAGVPVSESSAGEIGDKSETFGVMRSLHEFGELEIGLECE